MSDLARPVIGISCGDLNGIGLEVVMKSLQHPGIEELLTPVLFASSKVVSYHRKALGMEHFNFFPARDLDQLRPDRPNLINCWQEEVILEFGKVSPVVGSYALQSLERACEAVQNGKVDALVTAPIHKKSIQSEKFAFTGHTDFLEAHFDGRSLMMMVSEEMRMALATVHLPLREVVPALNSDLILERLRQVHQSLLRDFGIRKGRIAVLALNPHAGDDGVMGREDQEIVTPAIRQAFDEGILAFGPFPADSFFGGQKHRKHDAVLAMYHDQGLIPFKSMSFGQGVNFTAGLEILRTSPDHGTGFDIAGQGIAREDSFLQALFLARDLARQRRSHAQISANPLPVNKGRQKDN